MTREEAIEWFTNEIFLINISLYPQDMETTIRVGNQLAAYKLALKFLEDNKND